MPAVGGSSCWQRVVSWNVANSSLRINRLLWFTDHFTFPTLNVGRWLMFNVPTSQRCERNNPHQTLFSKEIPQPKYYYVFHQRAHCLREGFHRGLRSSWDRSPQGWQRSWRSCHRNDRRSLQGRSRCGDPCTQDRRGGHEGKHWHHRQAGYWCCQRGHRPNIWSHQPHS